MYGELDKFPQHPRPEHNQTDNSRQQLGHERQRVFLDLRHHLQQANQKAYGHGQTEHRSANDQACPEQVAKHT